MTTQVILNGTRVGFISRENLSAFLSVSALVVVSHTPTVICLMKG